MDKRFYYILILGLIILGILFIVPRKNKIIELENAPSPPEVTTLKAPQKEKRRDLTQPPVPPDVSQDKVEDIMTDNMPSEEWQELFEEVIRAQAGSSIDTIDIKKTESVIVKRDKRTLAAESVVVTLTKPDGTQSSFRALVDSETGRVIETWDRPLFDPVHPNENFKIKVPAHYHGN